MKKSQLLAIAYRYREREREALEQEAKARGLWELWLAQSKYRTLRGFLRASDEVINELRVQLGV